MELILEVLFAFFNHSESLMYLKWISISEYQVQTTGRTFTKWKRPLYIDEKDFENILCLEIIISNLIVVNLMTVLMKAIRTCFWILLSLQFPYIYGMGGKKKIKRKEILSPLQPCRHAGCSSVRDCRFLAAGSGDRVAVLHPARHIPTLEKTICCSSFL